jgi:hypothetical protein
MTRHALDIHDSLLKAARKLAEQDGVTVDQPLTTALAEKLSALGTLWLIEQRASRADLDRYREILAKVPDVPPQPGDELPPEQ